MKLHTVFITYNRLELTKQAIESYLETVTVPFSLSLVDNDSGDGTAEWVFEEFWKLSPGGNHHILAENRYPGFAANMGWSEAPADASHLHRADNDFAFLPGWCDEVERKFSENDHLGQLGLRTDVEEQGNKINTGGNCVITRQLWDLGVRWDERSWPQLRDNIGPGWTEDSVFSKQVKKTRIPGTEKQFFEWDRVERPCIASLSVEDPYDQYYLKSWTDRGILENAKRVYGVT